MQIQKIKPIKCLRCESTEIKPVGSTADRNIYKCLNCKTIWSELKNE